MYEKQYIRSNGILMHVVMAGPKDGEPIMLLHGFPEFWYGWRRQIDFLAAQGYRVIVPDQRGYNLTDKPEGVDAYHLDELAADIIGLLDVLGIEKVHLAGHDWGAIVAWHLATRHEERLKKMAILNVPYPTVLLEQIKGGNWRQIAKSWYIGFFQIPLLSEGLISLGNYQGLLRTMKATSKPDTFSDESLENYRAAWSQPGAVKGMLNWYRAIAKHGIGRGRRAKASDLLKTPVLMLWGEQDIVLSKEMAPASIALCADGELIFYPEATHWVQHDEADAINAQFLRFFTKDAGSVKEVASRQAVVVAPVVDAPVVDAPVVDAPEAPAKKPAKSRKAKAESGETTSAGEKAPRTRKPKATSPDGTEDKPKAARKSRSKKSDSSAEDS